MAKRMTIMLTAVFIIFGGAIAWYFVKNMMIAKFLAGMKYPPAAVDTATVKSSSWQPSYSSVGTLIAPQSVSVLPEVAGMVDKIYFKSGDLVQQGQLLLTLDSRQEQAKLASDQASLRLARLDYQRDRRLFSQRAVAKQTLDTSFATLQQNQAAVQGDRVAIEQKQVKAPFAGRIGITTVSLGQYVGPTTSNSTIATLEQVDPLFVDFSLPQQRINDLKIGQPMQIKVDSYPNKIFNATISAIDVSVDQDSRMIKVRGVVPNGQQLLHAGMFADVEVMLPEQLAVITVPQTAITYNLYGDMIYVVKDGKAVQTFVTVGQRRGDEVAISKGLTSGQEIVVSGQLKLFNGSPVIVTKEAESTARG